MDFYCSNLSGNGNPKKIPNTFSKESLSYVFSKVSYSNILGNKNPKKIPYIFLKENFSYISRNRNLEKILYISGNGTFLYFRK